MRRRPLLLLPLAVVLLASCSGDGDDESGPSATTGAEAPGPTTTIADVVEVDVGENGHTTDPVEYGVDPPAGGKHHPEWLACGAYDEPVANENAVHALEHGAVWITHGELDDAAAASLAELADASGRLIVSPYPALDAGEVVASSWGRQLHLDGAEDPRLEEFIDAYVDSPDAPEPGASCS